MLEIKSRHIDQYVRQHHSRWKLLNYYQMGGLVTEKIKNKKVSGSAIISQHSLSTTNMEVDESRCQFA